MPNFIQNSVVSSQTRNHLKDCDKSQMFPDICDLTAHTDAYNTCIQQQLYFDKIITFRMVSNRAPPGNDGQTKVKS